MPRSIKAFEAFLIVALVFLNGSAIGADLTLPKAPESEIANLLGEKVPRGPKEIIWEAGIPPQSNLAVYAVAPRKFDEAFFKSLASRLGVRGEVQPLPGSIMYAPGKWIKEANPTNSARWKSLIFSDLSGTIKFASGEKNFRWDLKEKRPLVVDVPTEAEALKRTLELLPALGITTSDVEHLTNGTVKFTSSDEGTWYNDQHDNQKRKRFIRQINIELWQKVHDGASVLPIGGGGLLRAGFMSEGILAGLELTFRTLKRVGEVSGKSSSDLIRMIKEGDIRSFSASIPEKITITACRLVYPEANSMTRQDYLRPAYAIDAVSIENGEKRSLHFYVPLSW